ncbi:MAG: lipopolysaccharide biosynthesis protein [Burkholderiaceae bacterium]|nr:lipopolysaccharide biosynthesis protein [Burkholderiaceae bacterium]
MTRRLGGVFRRSLTAWRSGRLKLWNDYAVLAGGQVGIKVLGFLAFAWLARALDPTGYGAVEFLVGLAAFFSTVVDAGLGTVGVRRLAHHPAELPRLAFQIPLARLALALACVPIMLFVARSAAHSALSPTMVWLFALSLLTVPLRQEWLLQASERMTETAIARVLRASVFAVVIWLGVRAPADLPIVGAAELAAVVAMSMYCIYVQHAHIVPVRLSGSTRGMTSLVREGAALGAGNVIWSLNQYAPLFLIATLVGGAETAWFAAAARVVGALFVFGNIYHFSLYPALTRATARGDGELGRLLAGSMRITAWAGILLALALTLFALPLLVLAFGPRMAPSASLLEIMAWIIPVMLCSGHARWALVAAGAQTRVLWSELLGLVATVLVALAAGAALGAPGYALAALAGPVVVWVAADRFAARQGSSPPRFRIAARPALLAAAFVALDRGFSPAPWLSIGGLVLFAALAPVLDRQLLPDLVRLGAAKLGPQPAPEE